jgi:hypothetical protein
MKSLKSIAIIFCLALSGALFVPPAHASIWNQKMEIGFNQPVEIPGSVLPAGDYWFVLMNSPSNRNVVQVFNASQTKLLATLITIPTLRPSRNVSAKTEVVFAERRHEQPEALWKLYYPSLSSGHEFLYRQSEQTRLRRDAKQVALAAPMSQNINVAG